MPRSERPEELSDTDVLVSGQLQVLPAPPPGRVCGRRARGARRRRRPSLSARARGGRPGKLCVSSLGVHAGARRRAALRTGLELDRTPRARQGDECVAREREPYRSTTRLQALATAIPADRLLARRRDRPDVQADVARSRAEDAQRYGYSTLEDAQSRRPVVGQEHPCDGSGRDRAFCERRQSSACAMAAGAHAQLSSPATNSANGSRIRPEP